jgi:galactokinase
LSNEYEVSCKELDLLVEIASGIPGVTGARMMGGGFGGCTINLVQTDAVADFQKIVMEKYKINTDKEPKIYISSIESGAEIIE